MPSNLIPVTILNGFHTMPELVLRATSKALQASSNGTEPKLGSGRANGIAPVSPPTPPDMRFSASGG